MLTGDAYFPMPFVPVCGSPGLLSQTNSTYYGTHQTPYTIEYSLNIQRELMMNTMLTVGYVGTQSLIFRTFSGGITQPPSRLRRTALLATWEEMPWSGPVMWRPTSVC
jgi:hypothetical protein